jgi:hypothetical protein
MTKEEFIEFIKGLGFTQTWGSDSKYFYMPTDFNLSLNQNHQPFSNQLNIYFDDKYKLAQLSLSKMDTHISTGKNFGNFSLKTFGDKNDFQLEIFLSFILGSFDEKPKHIIQWMRDKKIQNILQ